MTPVQNISNLPTSNERINCIFVTGLLLEKDNIWYYPDYENNLVELFVCEPESIDTGSNF